MFMEFSIVQCVLIFHKGIYSKPLGGKSSYFAWNILVLRVFGSRRWPSEEKTKYEWHMPRKNLIDIQEQK